MTAIRYMDRDAFLASLKSEAEQEQDEEQELEQPEQEQTEQEPTDQEPKIQIESIGKRINELRAELIEIRKLLKLPD